jgi:sRNA-binding regulator protein Hfq
MNKLNNNLENLSENASALLTLAEKKFGKLLPSEIKFFTKVDEQKIADFSSESEEENKPDVGERWDSERVINSDRISWLCTDCNASKLVLNMGINVVGLRIDGNLNLQYSRIPFPLTFEKCYFKNDIFLTQAEIMFLNMSGTHTKNIYAELLRIQGNLLLNDNFNSEGEVKLLGAKIGGSLVCEKGTFINKGGNSILADGIEVGGCVFLRNGFKAEGKVKLFGAKISGDFVCINGTFINKGGNAISADRMEVGGGVFLRDGFKSEGEVKLLGAKIGGDFDCNNGSFINKEGNAISADGMKVSGSVFLRNGFNAEGEVRLLGAKIGGNLECDKSNFINKAGNAIFADGIEVGGNVFLRNSFKAEGRLSFCDSIIKSSFQLVNVVSPENIILDLRSAKIYSLTDEPKSWPEKNNLLIDGFVYDKIDDYSPKKSSVRIDWLHRQPCEIFRPQPYEQLAKVLREEGFYSDSTKIFYLKEKDRGKFTKMNFLERVFHKILGISVGYGYQTWRALLISIIFIMLGFFIFNEGYKADLISPTKKQEFSSEIKQQAVNSPKFNALIYSIDMFVPIVDLYQANYWFPDSKKKCEFIILDKFFSINGNCIFYYLWIHIISGWIYTTLIVASMTGLIRK